MTDDDYTSKLDELDRLLNDPDVPMQPARIWSLLAELSQKDIKTGMVSHAATPGTLRHARPPAE